MPTVYDKLSKAEELEIIAAKVYRRLASLFAGQEDTASLFRRLAEEEDQHAHRIRMLRSMATRDRRGVVDMMLDAEVVDGLIREGLIFLEHLSSPEIPSLREVTAAMADFEQRLGVVHADRIAAKSAPEIRKVFEQLSRQDRAHAELLRGSQELSG